MGVFCAAEKKHYLISPEGETLFAKVNKQQNPTNVGLYFRGGERGIRTPGPVTVNSFQDCRIRPLCHFSSKTRNICHCECKYSLFFISAKTLLKKIKN